MNYPELANAAETWRYQPPQDCLAERAIVVTGAGDGIGAVAAKTFACYGADVILLGRTRAKLDGVFDWISANTTTNPVIVPCDLAQLGDDNAAALATSIEETYGRLDGILHNASVLGPRVPLDHYPTPEWATAMAVNATAPFVLTKALLPLLLAAPRAAILFTSSTVGREGRAYWGAYAVSKFAQEGLMEVWADELAATSNVLAATINPGGTRTGMRQAAYPAEDPQSVPPPESHMDLYLYVMQALDETLNGAKLSARDWQGPI